MEAGRSDVRVSLHELVCVISVPAYIFTLENKSFLFLSASWLAHSRGQVEMERPRYRLQVMLQAMRAGKYSSISSRWLENPISENTARGPKSYLLA